MKKTLSFIMLVTATLFFLLLTIIPHHHHGAMDCFVMERCVIDGDINDCHTHHHESGESDSCDILHLKQTVMTAKKHTTQNQSQQSQNIITAFVDSSAVFLLRKHHAEKLIATAQPAGNQWKGSVLCMRGPPSA